MSCKLQLKKWGKGENRVAKKIGDDEIDIFMALSDQDELIKSYGYSRKDRVLRRDGLNRGHPVIPLKEIRDKNGNIIGPEKPCNALDDENSSDEERRKEEIKLKKKKAVFANCYICQMDPARQHLHTLGNISANYEPSKLTKKTDYVMDKLHWKKNLMINFNPEFFPETIVKGENINFIRAGGCLYIRRCLRSFRRSEYGDHYLSQHVNSLTSISELIVRCPNWLRGCEFHTYRLKPKKGRIRFLDCIDSFIHCPEEIKPFTEYSGVPLDSLPMWAILAISKYLSSADLRLLSTVSRTLREILFTSMKESSMATIKWSKHLGRWVEDGIIYEFSTADRPTKVTWSPANELSNHLKTCIHSDAITYEEGRICVFPEELKQDIQDKFMERLKSVSSWWSTYQFSLGEEFDFL